MWYLDKDVLFLIFEEIKNDKKSLYSCILVNRTWCVEAIPLLWRNPWQTKSNILLFNVILSHLSKESRDILEKQGINNLITESYQRPLFNYIKFCKYLNLFFLENVISLKKFEKSKISIIRNEILKLFINENTKFNILSIPNKFNFQLHLIPGAEHCFSELESFYCRGNVDQNVLEGLAKICKSIKRLSASINYNISGIIKLIEVQKKLKDVNFISLYNGGSYYKSLEESLIKHAVTIQYLRIEWTPITRFLSHLVNLSSLEIYIPIFDKWNDLNYYENLSLLNLKTLKTRQVPSKVITNIIKNTKGHLTEISIFYVDNEILIQTIYQNCPKLSYLHLSLINNNSLILEIKNLLIYCQFLNGLIINVYDNYGNIFSWDKFFIILAKSSPISLFKFKFFSTTIIKLEDIKLFFDNWKDKNPMLLLISNYQYSFIKRKQIEDLFVKYETKGIIKKYSISAGIDDFENFEWI
jgi:hypothetical protein